MWFVLHNNLLVINISYLQIINKQQTCIHLCSVQDLWYWTFTDVLVLNLYRKTVDSNQKRRTNCSVAFSHVVAKHSPEEVRSNGQYGLVGVENSPTHGELDVTEQVLIDELTHVFRKSGRCTWHICNEYKLLLRRCMNLWWKFHI